MSIDNSFHIFLSVLKRSGIRIILAISLLAASCADVQGQSPADSVNIKILALNDPAANDLYYAFAEKERFSYNYFEDAFALAQYFIRNDQYNLSGYFLQSIIDNRDKYPHPEKWGRLSSKSFLLMGQLCEKTGDKHAAIKNYKISAGEYENYYGPGNFNIPFVNSRIASLNTSVYNYEEAIIYYKKNLLLAGDSDPEENLHLLKYISQCYSYLNEDDIGLEYLEQALDIYKNNNLDDKELLARIFNTAGNIYEGKEQAEKALNSYKKAKNIWLKEYGPESTDVAFSNNSIGNIFLARAEYDSAMHYYRESLRVRELTLSPPDKYLTHSYYNVGYTYSKLGLMDSALIYCDKSIASNLGIEIKQIPELNYRTALPVSVKDLIVSLTDKAEYYYLLFNSDPRKNELIEKSFTTINNALEYSNQIAGKIANYYSDLSWIQFEKRLLDLMVKIYYRYDLNIKNQENISLKASLIKKNRIHNKYFYLYNNDLSSGVNGGDFLHYSKLQLEQILADKGINDLESFSLEDHAEKDRPDVPFFDINLNKQTIILSQIPGMLGKNQVILDYLISDSLLIIHSITKNGIKKYSTYIPGLEKEVEAFSSGLKKMNDIAVSSENLFEILLKPVYDSVSAEEIIIIPDEYLYRVPFETLSVQSVSGHFEYLLNRSNILYSFSINNLLRNNLPERESYSLHYTGWTPFGDRSSGLYLSNSADTIYTYEYLPEAKNEIELIGNYYTDIAGSSKLFSGPQANLENLLAHRDQSAVIHFATHNIVDYQSPFLSHLVLYFDNNSKEKFNQILFLPTVPYLGLKADLVILDGCETGNGKLLASEGLLSMAHAISANDVSSVVQSLWRISDKLAMEFTLSLVKHYNSSKDLGKALREVKLEFINSSYNHPYFWAGILGYKNYF